jgi:hypothetical protein
MKRILNIRVILGAFTVASLLLCATLVYLLWMRPAAPSPGPGPAPAALTVIPAPSSTPRRAPPTLTPTPAFSYAATATPLPGAFALNVYVQISGTEGQGLHLRALPGLDSAPLDLGYDAEVFQITAGPQQADGYTWWYLTAPYDRARAGWAVQDFLSVIPSP